MSRGSEQRRRQILAAAWEAFCSGSIESVSMAEIAQRAEIGKSTIYEYFDSKNELIVQTAEWIVETLGQQVREIFATDLCFRDQMCRYVESVIGGVRGAGNAENVMQIISVYGMEAMRCSADRIRELVLDRIRFGICRAVARGELPPEIEENRAALLLWALLNPAMIAYMRDAGEEHSVEQAVDTVLYGLCSAGKKA